MKNILKDYGLHEKESEVYLAALELGEATGAVDVTGALEGSARGGVQVDTSRSQS